MGVVRASPEKQFTHAAEFEMRILKDLRKRGNGHTIVKRIKWLSQ